MEGFVLKNKLVAVPFFILFALSIFVVFFENSSASFGVPDSAFDDAGNIVYDYWYDSGGRIICYGNWTRFANVTEAGAIMSPVNSPEHRVSWSNSTGVYPLYQTATGNYLSGDIDLGFTTTSTIGFLAIVGGIMLMAVAVGFRFFSSGVSDVSVMTVIKGTALLGLWAIVSVKPAPYLFSVPVVGSTLFFLITAIYTVGIIGSISGA